MSNVVVGTGKPRIVIPWATILTNTVGSATLTTVVLGSAVDLTTLDSTKTLKGRLITTYTSADVLTYGVIQSYDDPSDTLMVLEWSNGTPGAGKSLIISNFQIDLPYCQSLIERWTPDFVTKIMYNGDIKVTKRGFYYSAVLNYAQFLTGSWVELLAPIFATNRTEFYFYPRRDNTAVSFVVEIDESQDFNLSQYQNHRGHRNVIIYLRGLRRLTEINLTPTPDSPGYGDLYGGSIDHGYGEVL